MRINVLLVTCLAALAACEGPTAPVTAPVEVEGRTPQQPRPAIQHWSTYGTQQFYFLPSTPPTDVAENSFDATLSPTVTLCKLTGTTCGSTIASWTKTSGSYSRLLTVNTSTRSYNVSWPTGSTSGMASGQTYRIAVKVGTRTLGFEDVKTVSSNSAGAAVDTSQFRWVVSGQSFAISFRINQGIPASISLSTGNFTVGVGSGKTVTATVLDLRGQVMSNPDLGWEIDNISSAPGPVALLDDDMVIGNNTGTATLWAWIEDIEVSITVTVNDTRRQWTAMTTPDNQGNRAIWGTSSTNMFAANWTGVMRYNGTSWSHVAAARWRTMNDVVGLSSTNVWAVGDNGLMLKFDGTNWSGWRFDGNTVAPYNLNTWALPGSKIALRALWAMSPFIVAVGDSGYALYNDGTSWNQVETGITAAITDVWGSSANDVYGTTADGKLWHWDGAGVWKVTTVSIPGSLNGVWGSSSSNVYTVGDNGALYRYNGSSWQKIQLPTHANLYAVWGTSSSNVFVGGAGNALYRYDGSTWTAEKLPLGQQIYSFWGDGTNVWASGAGGYIAKR